MNKLLFNQILKAQMIVNLNRLNKIRLMISLISWEQS